jgi:hypothetical protein
MLNNNPSSMMSSVNTPATGSSDSPSRLSPLEAIINTLHGHHTPMNRPPTKRKRQIERPYGQSLTSIDALMQLQEKENNQKKKNKAELLPKKTSIEKKRGATSRQ